MRILFAVLSPIGAELGAAQIAMNLAGELRSIGIDAVLWSPYPIPSEIPWWRRVAWVRKKIAEYVRQSGPFDLVDVPAVAVSRSLASQCSVVARDVQPEILYYWTEIRHAGRLRPFRLAAWLVSILFDAYLTLLVLAGWSRARFVMCLGSAEHAWMTRWFPWLRRKASIYFSAPNEQDRRALERVRRDRRPRSGERTRFLWIGRWAEHKGPDRLLRFIEQHLQRHPHDSVTIAGCGDAAARSVRSAKLPATNVTLLPSYDHRDLPTLLADHDAGLFTSRVEGWGLSLQEMLEAGLPVYATDTGAVSDLRQYFPGQLMPFPPAPEEIATHLPSNVTMPKEYTTRFSWGAIARHYIDCVSNGAVKVSRGAARA